MSSAPITCRSSERRATLRAANHEHQGDLLHWTGIDYAEFESLDTEDIVLVELLCPPTALDNARQLPKSCFLLWDETDRREIPLAAVEPLDQLRYRLKPKCRLSVDRRFRVLLRGMLKIDPQYASYSFAATAAETIADPVEVSTSALETADEPQANYLARDFSSLRQVLLDRLSLLIPEWKERHVPDLGMTLVELFAYVGDYLSYYQDSVATEAYLHTARQRISVRRHARLVDYQLHEGCGARAFVNVNVEKDIELDPHDVFFITAHPDAKLEGVTVLSGSTLENVSPASYQAFEIACPTPRVERFAPSAIKNPIGLIGALVEQGSIQNDSTADPVLKRIWNHLPEPLRRSLQAFANQADSPPAARLVQALATALDSLLSQGVLRDLPGSSYNESAQATGDVRADDFQVPGSSVGDYLLGDLPGKVKLYEAHNSIFFYTWSGRECCLPKGATRATLYDSDAVEISSNATGAKLLDSTMTLCEFVQARMREPWRLRKLSRGDVLLFEEVLGPRSHLAADADPTHRQAVRLTDVKWSCDPLTKTRIVEIEWEPQDALRFPLCISSIGPVELGCRCNDRISVARGNVVLVDQGQRIDEPEWIGEVHYRRPAATCYDDEAFPAPPGDPATVEQLRPVLTERDLTFSMPVDCSQPAVALFAQTPEHALPALQVFGFPMASEPADSVRSPDVAPRTLIQLTDLARPYELALRYHTMKTDEQRRLEAFLPPTAARFLQMGLMPAHHAVLRSMEDSPSDGIRKVGVQQSSPDNRQYLEDYNSFAEALRKAVTWDVQAHLLNSRPDDRHLVVEIDNERHAHLRFGDGDLGRQPADKMSFYAVYRRGAGVGGNIGSEKIKHLVFRTMQQSSVRAVRNPQPALAGSDPETLDHARLHAPQVFKKLRRAITVEDYARIVQQKFAAEIQQACATLRWTGTWFEVAVAVDPFATVRDPQGLARRVQTYLRDYRRIGHRVRVDLPRYVGLRIDMIICVAKGASGSHVRSTLLDRFSNRTLADGTKGFFHPDQFSFGSALYLSQLVTAAKHVRGVENVVATRFERWQIRDPEPLESGVLSLAPFEIPRLDNNPSHPELGVLSLDLRGAR